MLDFEELKQVFREQEEEQEQQLKNAKLIAEAEESERMDNVRDAINEKFSIQEGK